MRLHLIDQVEPSLTRRILHALEATWLNLSALMLQLRIRLFLKDSFAELDSFVNASEQQMELRFQEVLEHELDENLRGRGLGGLALHRVTMNALHGAGIENLLDLKGVSEARLQSIPNIGPMRSSQIATAFDREVKKLALKGFESESFRHAAGLHLAILDAHADSKARLKAEIDELYRLADAFFADVSEYCINENVRIRLKIHKNRLWQRTSDYLRNYRNELGRLASTRRTYANRPYLRNGIGARIDDVLSGRTYKVKAGRTVLVYRKKR